MANGQSSTDAAHASVIFPSEQIPDDAIHVTGPNFDNPIDLHGLMESYSTIGFQASGLSKAIHVVEHMASGTHRLG